MLIPLDIAKLLSHKKAPIDAATIAIDTPQGRRNTRRIRLHMTHRIRTIEGLPKVQLICAAFHGIVGSKIGKATPSSSSRPCKLLDSIVPVLLPHTSELGAAVTRTWMSHHTLRTHTREQTAVCISSTLIRWTVHSKLVRISWNLEITCFTWLPSTAGSSSITATA